MSFKECADRREALNHLLGRITSIVGHAHVPLEHRSSVALREICEVLLEFYEEEERRNEVDGLKSDFNAHWIPRLKELLEVRR